MSLLPKKVASLLFLRRLDTSARRCLFFSWEVRSPSMRLRLCPSGDTFLPGGVASLPLGGD